MYPEAFGKDSIETKEASRMAADRIQTRNRGTVGAREKEQPYGNHGLSRTRTEGQEGTGLKVSMDCF